VSERGAPLYLRSDNGPEFVSRALLKWIVDQGIGTALIDPGDLPRFFGPLLT
jgi:putative transposase